MKSIRLFLYALIGITCLALWSAWQQDYPSHPQEATTTTATTTATPSEPLTQATADASTASATPQKIAPALSKAPSQRLITVRTDVLEVTIDSLGGNVVGAKLLKYSKSLQEQDQPVQILNDNPDNLYVAHNILKADPGNVAIPAAIPYSAIQKNYVLAPSQNELTVKLLWHDNQGLLVTKALQFTRGKYAIYVNYNINNHSNQDFNGKLFTQLTQKALPEPQAFFAFRTFTGASISSPDKAYEKLSYSDLGKKDLSRDIKGGWLSFQQHYFLSAWVPQQNQTYHYYSKTDTDANLYTLGLAQNLSIPAQGKASATNTLYIGPEVAANLKPLAPHLEMTVDYGWLWFISIMIFWVMQQIYKLVGNWGWSIIIVTVLIKAAFYKFSEKSYASMAKMRDLAPRIKTLQERFGKDKQKLSQATMELYRKEKVNPLGGCLPIVIQIPVFIALYYVLMEAVELRQAPFIFWIHDLATKDPYYVLPILMGISMLIQQKLNPPPPDPMQAKMMMLLPIVFTVFFISFPSGLVLYWLVNNCLSALQQWYIMRKVSSGSKK